VDLPERLAEALKLYHLLGRRGDAKDKETEKECRYFS
jgi:hypothetical protein